MRDDDQPINPTTTPHPPAHETPTPPEPEHCMVNWYLVLDR